MKKIWLIAAALVYMFHSSPAKSQALVDVSCAPPGSTQPVSCRTPGLGNAGYPPGATPWFQSATGTTAGTTATASGVAGQFTYICGWIISPGAATAAVTIALTSTGLGSNNLNLSVGAPAAAAGTTGALQEIPQIGPCLRSTAVNTSISMSAGALGAGGVNQAVNSWGYYQ